MSTSSSSSSSMSSSTPPPPHPPLPHPPNPLPLRHQLGKIGHFLNYSDDDDDFDKTSESDAYPRPTSSLTEIPPSPSPFPVSHSKPEQNIPLTSPSASLISSPSAEDPSAAYVSELKSAVLNSSSATDAALAFQRWRHVRLKMIFSQELKKTLEAARQDEAWFLSLKEEMERKDQHLVDAIADSSHLRSHISALENVKKPQQGFSDQVETLQQELVKAVERANSAEEEVERYNKEIRNLRERLKASEDEACRLDSELKATTALTQKERSGLAEENRVLLEQLSRKDEEVLSNTQEINNLKAILAGLKVSRMELDRLKAELQDNSKKEVDYAKYEEKDNKQLQALAETDRRTSVVCFPKPQAMAENAAFLPQLVELLQKLIMCLQKNDNSLDSSIKRASPNVVSSDLFALKEVTRLGDLGENKGTINRDSNKTLAITCWKWRWAAAACEVQALTRELDTLKSLSKEVLRKSPFISGSIAHNPEKGRLSMHKNAESKLVKTDQFPLPFNKFFSLLASIWQTSSQSFHLEKELALKRRQMEHLLCVMTRWMQRILKKRQLQKAIIHWLLYLLKSQRSKFKLQCASKAEIAGPVGPISVSKRNDSDLQPKFLVRDCLQIYGRRNHNPKYEKSSVKPEVGAFIHHDYTSERALHFLKDVFHHKLEEAENVVLKEASSWFLKQLQEKHNPKHKTTKESKSSVAATGLASKICREFKRCFDDACNEIMVIFHIPGNEFDVEKNAGSSVKTCTPRPQVKIHTIKKATRVKA